MKKLDKIKQYILHRVNYDCDEYIEIYRKYNITKNKIKKLYYLIKKNNYERKYNCFIPFSAKLGNNLNFPHGLNGIFISGNAIIGDNTTIFHQVTIGSNNLNNSINIGSPKIGKNVYIGTGAKIIGNVNIEDNVRIGANCVVTQNIKANSTVVLNKPRIIIHNTKRNNEFVKINVNN